MPLMPRDEIISSLSAALPGLTHDYAVRSLFVFGSVARGDDRPDSDVDVLIEFDPQAHPTLFTLAAIHARLTDLLHRKVDLGTVDSLRTPLRASVLSEMLRVA